MIAYQEIKNTPLGVFAWLVAYNKLNAIDKLKRRRPYKALSPGDYDECETSFFSITTGFDIMT